MTPTVHHTMILSFTFLKAACSIAFLYLLTALDEVQAL